MIAIQQDRLRPLLVLVLYLSSAVVSATAQQPAPEDSRSRYGDIDYQAVLVVENLWNYASSGELLNPEGWTHVMNQFFTQPSPVPRDLTVVVNRYWISNASRKDDKIEITVESAELGQIDSQLRFVATPSQNGNPNFYMYRLVFAPTPMRWYGPDGKTLTKETMTGPKLWKIEGPLGYRWTTLNTAIRYVSEARDNSNDPVGKRNAEKTLDVLRKFK